MWVHKQTSQTFHIETYDFICKWQRHISWWTGPKCRFLLNFIETRKLGGNFTFHTTRP